ncbi:MAG: hypothetical protein LBU74_05090 [Methanobacteriaceae archaeon]|jgi:hypothetical protein|nr:hypothetical protein [Candidatus Methanorudis spinitermitis]
MEIQDLVLLVLAVLIGAAVVYLFLWALRFILPIIILLTVVFLVYTYLKSNNYLT